MTRTRNEFGLKVNPYIQAGKYLGRKAAEASGDVRETIRQLVICGNGWFDAGDMDKARDYCCKAFSMMKGSSDASLVESCFTITNSLFTIARIYRKNGEPDKALEYLERSIEFERALNRSHMINRRFEEKIEILIDEHRYDEAMSTFLFSLTSWPCTALQRVTRQQRPVITDAPWISSIPSGTRSSIRRCAAAWPRRLPSCCLLFSF